MSGENEESGSANDSDDLVRRLVHWNGVVDEMHQRNQFLEEKSAKLESEVERMKKEREEYRSSRATLLGVAEALRKELGAGAEERLRAAAMAKELEEKEKELVAAKARLGVLEANLEERSKEIERILTDTKKEYAAKLAEERHEANLKLAACEEARESAGAAHDFRVSEMEEAHRAELRRTAVETEKRVRQESDARVRDLLRQRDALRAKEENARYRMEAMKTETANKLSRLDQRFEDLQSTKRFKPDDGKAEKRVSWKDASPASSPRLLDEGPSTSGVGPFTSGVNPLPVRPAAPRHAGVAVSGAIPALDSLRKPKTIYAKINSS